MGTKRFVAFCFLLFCSILPTCGQASYELNALATIMTNFLPPKVAFSAQAIVLIKESEKSHSYSLDTFMQDANLRVDSNLSRSARFASDEAANKLAKGLGLDQRVEIAQTTTGQKVVLYPANKAYFVEGPNGPVPLPLRKVADGTETIDGQVCQRFKVFLANDKDPVMVWTANENQNFPVQIEVGPTIRLNFQNVKFGSQDSQLFKVPTGFTRTKDYWEVVDIAMQLCPPKSTSSKITKVHTPPGSITASTLQQHKLKAADQKALDFQIKRAAEGNATAQYDLGLRYWKGDGVEKNTAKAFEYMSKSAASGNSMAEKFLQTNAKR